MNIYNNEEYLNLFKEINSPDVIKSALYIALDIRKFEVDLYWKRATYFWAFIAISFAGFMTVLNLDKIDQYKELLILIALIGLFFSIGWYFVNRGSKYWYENWEQHIIRLEDAIIGPLLKTNWFHPNKFCNILSSYHFSVTKVNTSLSLLIVFLWIYLFLYSINFNLDVFRGYTLTILNIVYFSILTISFVLLMIFSKSHLQKERNEVVKNNLPIFTKKDIDLEI